MRCVVIEDFGLEQDGHDSGLAPASLPLRRRLISLATDA